MKRRRSRMGDQKAAAHADSSLRQVQTPKGRTDERKGDCVGGAGFIVYC